MYGCGEDSVEGLKKHFKQDNIVFALMKVVHRSSSSYYYNIVLLYILQAYVVSVA